jgi:hypothetical protein
MKIYTVVAYSKYFDSYDGNTFNVNDQFIKSFTTFEAAERYANALPYGKYDIVENEFEPEPFKVVNNIGGGFQNSGADQSDGLSGFRG